MKTVQTYHYPHYVGTLAKRTIYSPYTPTNNPQTHKLLCTKHETLLLLCLGRWKVHDYFLLLLCKSSIWFTEQHIFKIIIKICHKLCHFIWGFIGQKILKLWSQESRPFGSGWAANIKREYSRGPFVFRVLCTFWKTSSSFPVFINTGTRSWSLGKSVKFLLLLSLLFPTYVDVR